MSKNKFIFHKDEFGVFVFYTDMNKEVRYGCRSLKINKTIDFDPSINCVVPPVVKLSSCEAEDQITGYKSNVSGKTMAASAYASQSKRLQIAAELCHYTVEDEVSAQVMWRRFQNEWQPESQQVEVHTDYEFEIIDIEYPADERLMPLRHSNGERVNYFQVSGEEVALNLAHRLCKDEGLKNDDRGKQRGTYSIATYGVLQYWQIEGKKYGKPTEKLKLHNFIGNLAECRDYINEIEQCVRACFDEWIVSDKQPRGLTVGIVTKHLDQILGYVRSIDSKIRTRNAYNAAITLIQSMRQEIVQLGVEELLDEENLDDSLDNDTL